MGYNTSSAALAYDMNAMPAYRETPQAPVAPREQRTPRFDVYTGAGRQANQAVSPVFMSVLKTFCIIAAIFMTIGVARVALAGVTARCSTATPSLPTRSKRRPMRAPTWRSCIRSMAPTRAFATLRALMAWWSPARALHLTFRRMQPRAPTRPRPLSSKTVAEYDK